MYIHSLAKTSSCIYFLLSFILVLSFSVKADEALSLDEAIRLATENQPLLKSFEEAAASSREAAVAEGQLPDPKIKFGFLNLPVTNNEALRFSKDDQTMVNVGISQDIIPVRKREIASKRMEAEAESYDLDRLSASKAIERDVAMAWLDLFETQRKYDLYQRIIDEMNAERKVLIAKLSSSATQTNEVLKLDSRLSMANDKRLSAQRDLKRSRTNLSRWIGHASMRPMPADLPILTNPSIREQTLVDIEKHPLLLNALLTEKIAQIDVDKAQSDLQRNWGWEVGYGKRFASRSDMLTFQVSMDLQIDRLNRQDRRSIEKSLLVEKTQKLAEDKRRELSAELVNALDDAEVAELRQNEHITRLIPNAEALLSIALAAYQSGQQPLSEVWEARRVLIEVQVDHWTILTDRQRAAVRIQYLVNNLGNREGRVQ